MILDWTIKCYVFCYINCCCFFPVKMQFATLTALCVVMTLGMTLADYGSDYGYTQYVPAYGAGYGAGAGAGAGGFGNGGFCKCISCHIYIRLYHFLDSIYTHRYSEISVNFCG